MYDGIPAYMRETPQYVVAYAEVCKSEGRPLVLAYAGEKDPQAALALAQRHIQQFALEDIREAVRAFNATGDRNYGAMTDDEFRAALRYIVRESSDIPEINGRIEMELRFTSPVTMQVARPDDLPTLAYVFLHSIGVLRTASGALVTGSLQGANGIINF